MAHITHRRQTRSRARIRATNDSREPYVIFRCGGPALYMSRGEVVDYFRARSHVTDERDGAIVAWISLDDTRADGSGDDRRVALAAPSTGR